MRQNVIARENFEEFFNPVLRQRLRRKRVELGLSYQRLSEYLGVHWSTIRKWEVGPTAFCHVQVARRLLRLLTGGMDDEIQQHESHPVYGRAPRYLPDNARLCLERVGSTYAVCNRRHDLQGELLQQLETLSNSALTELMGPPPVLVRGGASLPSAAVSWSPGARVQSGG